MGCINKQGSRGFTIIEVMLFLAIGAFLGVIVIASFSSAIRTQQYRDITTNTKGFLQKQFTNVTNPYNQRQPSRCPADSTQTYVGRSKCIIIGRYITSTDNRATGFTSGNIIAWPKIGIIPSATATDYDALRTYYDYQTINSGTPAGNVDYLIEDFNLSGMALVNHTRGNNSWNPITMAIMRGPQSGDIMTFVRGDKRNATMAELLAPAGQTYNNIGSPVNKSGQILCVAFNEDIPQGLRRLEPPRVAIQIKPYATGPSAVEIAQSDSAPAGDYRRCGN